MAQQQLTAQDIIMLEQRAKKFTNVNIKQVANGYVITGRTQYVIDDQIAAEKTDQAIAPNPWEASDYATGYMMYHNFSTEAKAEPQAQDADRTGAAKAEPQDEAKNAEPVDPVPGFLKRQMEGQPLDGVEERFEREVAAQRLAEREGHGGTYPVRDEGNEG